MKLYAQDGHQRSDKVLKGLEAKVIDGVILSARCNRPDKISSVISDIRETNQKAEIMIDPEYYAACQLGNPNSQLRYLEDWEYFVSYNKREMIVKEGTVGTILKNSYEVLKDQNVTSFIAPNIYIPESFNSAEAGIALNFISKTKQYFEKTRKPVYATLALHQKALARKPNDFKSFLNDITALDIKLDGFYILVGGGLLDERSEFIHSEIIDRDVIASWMLINYALSLQGFKVINGYSDILSPFLGAVGGTAGASGWWSNLRVFSIGRYIKSEKEGGRQPNIRYLSKELLNRITVDERKRFVDAAPDVLAVDHNFDAGLPDRTTEAIQNWEALSSLNADFTQASVADNLKALEGAITTAKEKYAELASHGFSDGKELVDEYLGKLQGGIEDFRKYAEI